MDDEKRARWRAIWKAIGQLEQENIAKLRRAAHVRPDQMDQRWPMVPQLQGFVLGAGYVGRDVIQLGMDCTEMVGAGWIDRFVAPGERAVRYRPRPIHEALAPWDDQPFVDRPASMELADVEAWLDEPTAAERLAKILEGAVVNDIQVNWTEAAQVDIRTNIKNAIASFDETRKQVAEIKETTLDARQAMLRELARRQDHMLLYGTSDPFPKGLPGSPA